MVNYQKEYYIHITAYFIQKHGVKTEKNFKTDYLKNNDRSVLVKLGLIWFHKVKYGIFVCSAIDFSLGSSVPRHKGLGTTGLEGPLIHGHLFNSK
jgi:hypothetical protein